MTFQNKNCIVTGGANGIGRCIAEEFIKAGAAVFAIDTDAGAGKMLQDAYPGKYFFFAGDIAEQKTLDDFITAVQARFSRIDVLVNNAAISRRGLLSECGYDDFNYVMRIGVSAPYYLTLKFKEHFSPQAAVVNISSTRSFMSQPDTESYSATKGAITALTHAMAASLAGKVRVNAVSPGWIETSLYHTPPQKPEHTAADEKQHPAGRVGVPQDIAEMVMFLCSDKAGFITGQDFAVDGGMSKYMIFNGDWNWSYTPPAGK